MTRSTSYDIIICGGGCAGLSLAYRLCDPTYEHLRILIIDRDHKESNDRTWSFWHQGGHPFEEIVHHEWSRVSVYGEYDMADMTIAPYTYQTIRGIDFYDFCKKRIKAASHIEWLHEEVIAVSETEDHVVVTLNDRELTASYAFDSIVRDFPTQDKLFVWQHFLGWIIKTDKACFDPDCATFMDFRTDQAGETRFIYVLPTSETEALVEATIFGKALVPDDEYERMIKNYIHEYLDGIPYSILEVEKGKIPMTTSTFDSRSTTRIIPIGTRNATVKPSSGYAFVRIQEEVDHLAQSIKKSVIRPAKRKWRYNLYDKTLLNVLITNKVSGRQVFSMLFHKNTPQAIFRFLDEKSTLWDEIKLFSTLPFWAFLRAFFVENVWRRTK